MKILVINPGATSTKICVFEDEKEVMRVGIDHEASEIAKYPHVVDQAPFRKEAILNTITEKGYKLEDFDAICGRGGLFKHIPSGTYKVNGTPVKVFNADKMQFKAFTLGKSTYENIRKLYGAGQETGENAPTLTGRALRVNYEWGSAWFTSEEQVLYAISTNNPAMTGPQGSKVGMKSAEVMALFRDRGQAANAKGNRSQAVTDACKKHGGFYLGSIGGPAAILAQNNIKSIECVEYPELGMEAIWKIRVEDFPAFILVDDKGNDFFKTIGL